MGRPSFVVIFAVTFCAVVFPNVLELWRHLVARIDDRQQTALELQDDHSEWYTVDANKLTPALRDKFVQMTSDGATVSYLEECVESSNKLHWQMLHNLARTVLSFFMTKTSINGLLDKTGMFVFSEQQFRRLLGVSNVWQADKLLDIGAGNGAITTRMADHFQHVFVTELSKPMVWRLQDRGFSVLLVDDWHNGSLAYDAISCLNVLDRCDRPVTMLQDMERVLLSNTGRLVVAVVIPVKQRVETMTRGHRPEEWLEVRGNNFEEQVSSLVSDVLEPAGFELISFTRLPYISPGDMHKSYYMLTDAVFVLKRAS